MKKIGFVGWRGMVGSVLLSRMVQESDFNYIDPYFYTTSQVGEPAPNFNQQELVLRRRIFLFTCRGGICTADN